MIEERWLSVDEASEYLGIKRDTLYKWIKKGKNLPVHRIGDKLLKFKLSELDEWVRSEKSSEQSKRDEG